MSRAAPKATAGVAHERSLAETAYEKLKASIFDFELLPGDRFSETDIAGRLSMSRTPVRDALYRLEREGYLQVHLRVGWSVRPMTSSSSRTSTTCASSSKPRRSCGCATCRSAPGSTR